jgi:hypothetical protein
VSLETSRNIDSYTRKTWLSGALELPEKQEKPARALSPRSENLSDILLSYPVYWWAMDIKIILGIVVVVIVLAVYLFGPTAMAYYNGAIKKD